MEVGRPGGSKEQQPAPARLIYSRCLIARRRRRDTMPAIPASSSPPGRLMPARVQPGAMGSDLAVRGGASMKGPPLKLNNAKISSELLTLYVTGGPALLKGWS